MRRDSSARLCLAISSSNIAETDVPFRFLRIDSKKCSDSRESENVLFSLRAIRDLGI